MWTNTFIWILIACVLLQAAIAGPKGRKKALKKERKELNKLLKTLEKKTKAWEKSWNSTRKLEKQKLTKIQSDYWRKLSEYIEDDDDEDIDKRSVHEPEEELKHLSRTKRSGPLIPRPKRTRKEWRHMTTIQKERFVNAFHEISIFVPDPINAPGVTVFDIFVRWHRFSNAPGAHRGASFLPWHREFLWRLSNALRLHGYRGGLPYFDSALDERLPVARDSALWIAHPEGLGICDGSLGAPFSAAVTTQIDECFDGNTVTRFCRSTNTLLYTLTKYQRIMSKQCYHFQTRLWDSDMESFHNTGHVFIGGTMLSAACSPGDPVFWLHHCNVDCLWEEFRQQRQQAGKRTLEYPLTQFGTPDMAWNAIMRPFEDWGLTNIHGLSNHYGSYYYRCEERPSSIVCTSTEQCSPQRVTNPMLWCDTNTNFCVAKIRENQGCVTSWPHEQCYCVNVNDTAQCNQGTCRCVISP